MSFVCISVSSDVDVIGALPLHLELFVFLIEEFGDLEKLSFFMVISRF